MAVRFSAETQAYSTLLSVPAGAYTVTWWAKLYVGKGYATMWEPGSTSDTTVYTQVGMDADTTYGIHTAGGGTLNGVYPMVASTVDNSSNWHCFAVTQTAAGGTLRAGYGATPGSMTWANITAPSAAPTTLRLGRSVWSGEWFNGALGPWKQWGAVLTDAECVTELGVYAPQRAANFVRSFDFKTLQTTPSAGSGDLTAGSASPTVVTGPNIPDSLAAFSSRPPHLARQRRIRPLFVR